MRTILCIILLLFSTTGMWAQSFQSVDEAKNYFVNNIQKLDPIEGLYDVENILEINSAYAGREIIKQHFVCAIFKMSEENFFYVHSINSSLKINISG